jgi:RNA polymerase sigma factor FliA
MAPHSPRPCPEVDKRNELVLENLPLARAVAAKLRVHLPAHIDFSDLVQAGLVGLIDAAHKYDVTAQVSFATYATHRIKGAILDSLRREDAAPRKLRRQARELDRIRGELAQELKRLPTDHEVSERSGVDLAEVRQTAVDLHHLTQMSMSESVWETMASRKTASEAEQPDTIYEEAVRFKKVQEVIGKLPVTYRTVIVMHYCSEVSLKEMSESFGVQERQMSRIHTRALNRFQGLLRTNGIQASSHL